ncbi:Tetratricopeptide repeat protein 1 [Trichinella zimbabwensis]|uniref:Tetratricopeptide repeat protein 1 n=1 Tax=Trichinella zimbabwensis TaxID=268475 RepID=A0A0V1HCF9_9BILA|nr:Tetratricopeptide repeat protein 1 [Trichinella zimbabwensis]
MPFAFTLKTNQTTVEQTSHSLLNTTHNTTVMLLKKPKILSLMLLCKRMISLRPAKPGKPPILPPAKSKRYRVVHVPWHDPEDVKEMLWRRHIYMNALKSMECLFKIVRRYYRDRLSGSILKSVDGTFLTDIENEFRQLLLKNDELNKLQQEKREKEFQAEKEKLKEEMIQLVEQHLNKNEEQHAVREKEVLEMIENSKHFLTYENLDEKIEEALESPTDFNYALDLNGKMFKGKPLEKYNKQNLLLIKPVSEETEPLIYSGNVQENLQMENVENFGENKLDAWLKLQDKAAEDGSSVKCLKELCNDVIDKMENVDSVEEFLKMEETDMDEKTKLERQQEAIRMKIDGNAAFRDGDFPGALRHYTDALKICPRSFTSIRSVLFGNRAACYMKMEKYEEAIKECNWSVECDSNYVKVLRRRASLYEMQETTLEKALDDYKRLFEIDPADSEAARSMTRLSRAIDVRNEKMKAHAFDTMKELGNVLLQPFGLSTDDFQCTKRPDGSV